MERAFCGESNRIYTPLITGPWQFFGFHPARNLSMYCMQFARKNGFVFALAALVVLATSFESIQLEHALSSGPDEGVYLIAARLLNHGYSYTSFFLDQFALFPGIMALALRLGGDSALVGRLTIVLFFCFGRAGACQARASV